MHLGNKKTSTLCGCFLAGAEGIEPTSKVLETFVLPLNDAPLVARRLYKNEKKREVTSHIP